MLKKISSFLFFFSLCYSFCLSNATVRLLEKEQKVIIFDIGGVLLLTDSFYSLKKLGIKNMLWYAWEKKSVHSDPIRSKFFDLLVAIEPYKPEEIYRVKDDHGVCIPPLMLRWLTGTSGSVIKKEIKNFMEKNKKFFSSKEEYELIKNLGALVFTPSSFIESRKINKDIVKLLPKLAATHKILLCSNWDTESFEYCRKKFPEIFNYVEGSVISGDEQCLKPNPLIFKRLIEKYKINPLTQSCVFIDDQKENRTAAKQFGFKVYHPCTFKKIMCSLS